MQEAFEQLVVRMQEISVPNVGKNLANVGRGVGHVV